MSNATYMNPATSIIAKVGGPAQVAAITGAHYTRVCRWQYPRGDRNGTDGIIPHAAAMRLIKWAKRRKVDLTAEHFMQDPSVAA